MMFSASVFGIPRPFALGVKGVSVNSRIVCKGFAADLATPRLNARAMQTRGVIQIESKEDIRDRLGRSPGKGDGVVTCLQHGGLREYERKQTPRLPATAHTGYSQQKKFATSTRR